MKKVSLLAVMLFVAVLLINTLLYTSQQQQVEAIAPIALDQDASLQRLSDLLRFKTISYESASDFDPQPFIDLRHYVEQAFPRVHQQMSPQVFGDYSLLYYLPGSDPSLKPIALMAHIDVVPVEAETRQQWTHPPFSGAIEDGVVWGRGALDDKSSMGAILEAMEYLLANDLHSQRGIYLAFGHDEELGGNNGMAVIADHLQQRGVQLEFILDEGGAITSGISASLTEPAAIIAIAEKGGISLELTMNGDGGHSSQPPAVSTIGALSRAIVALEENQMPATLDGPTGLMFDTLAREMGFVERLLFANRWLTEPLLLKTLSKKSSINAMLRTTTAPTIFNSGMKQNVLPSSAIAIVNFRLLPGDSAETVIEHVKSVIDNPAIDIKIKSGVSRQASAVADHRSSTFLQLEKTIKQVMPGTITAPNLLVGGTDTKHMTEFSDNIYHFAPFRLHQDNLSAIHGINERLPADDYINMIRFYSQLVINSTQVNE